MKKRVRYNLQKEYRTYVAGSKAARFDYVGYDEWRRCIWPRVRHLRALRRKEKERA